MQVAQRVREAELNAVRRYTRLQKCPGTSDSIIVRRRRLHLGPARLAVCIISVRSLVVVSTPNDIRLDLPDSRSGLAMTALLCKTLRTADPLVGGRTGRAFAVAGWLSGRPSPMLRGLRELVAVTALSAGHGTNGPANKDPSGSRLSRSTALSAPAVSCLVRVRKHRLRLACLARRRSNILSFTVFKYLKEK